MSNLESITQQLPEHAKDLSLNLRNVLTSQGAPGLSDSQIWMTALASAEAARYDGLLRALHALAASRLDAASIRAARTAAALMAMNNVYYRFTHLVEDSEYGTMPARLRMNALANPGIASPDFELLALAVSAINGCGRCITAHEAQLRKHGFNREAIQSAVRIAAVVQAVAVVLQGQVALGPVATQVAA
jgi:alkyl hydroperoxide reductase subunit D